MRDENEIEVWVGREASVELCRYGRGGVGEVKSEAKGEGVEWVEGEARVRAEMRVALVT